MIFESFAVLSLITVFVVFTVVMCAVAISVALDWGREAEWERVYEELNKRAQDKCEHDWQILAGNPIGSFQCMKCRQMRMPMGQTKEEKYDGE